ncbi:MAG: dephospho-CoA kinase [Desulfomonilia bacterium]|jgi:dephospho-CoA kinase
MLVAGLTGSIATGKSTVSFILKDLGAFIVDADASAREVVAPGMRAWDKIIEIFGKGILQKTGEIDREHLGRLVFNDAAMRRMLEEAVHPEVIRAMNERIGSIKVGSPDAVVILDVPLLIETGMHKGLSEVIVVYCPLDMQITRLMIRDKISKEEALKRVRAQISIEEKRSYASLLIDNSASKDETRKQVEIAYVRLKEEATKAKG